MRDPAVESGVGAVRKLLVVAKRRERKRNRRVGGWCVASTPSVSVIDVWVRVSAGVSVHMHVSLRVDRRVRDRQRKGCGDVGRQGGFDNRGSVGVTVGEPAGVTGGTVRVVAIDEARRCMELATVSNLCRYEC